MTNKVKIVDVTSPPTTTVAKGRCTSLPTPVANSSGINPSAVVNGKFYESKEDILELVGKSIFPGKPEEIGLLDVLNQSDPVGKRRIVMPPPGTRYPKWSENELALFVRWIEQGAEDN